MRRILLFFFIIFPYLLNAQVHWGTMYFSTHQQSIIIEDKQLTGIQIYAATAETLWLNDTIQLQLTQDHSVGYAAQWIFATPQNNIRLTREKGGQELQIQWVSVPEISIDWHSLDPANKKNTSFCEKPFAIGREVWRQGLPDPKPGRVFQESTHLIVHHAASSNTDTNYLNTVRNIYLLHLQSNGWDDIGYNYLIAPDGTLFEGRDPLDEGDEDRVQGAHFCGHNSYAMGICFIGNYEDTSPTDTAISTLEHLLTWKSKKEHINPLGQSNHPHTETYALNHITGHREGFACNTVCPGDSLFDRLNQVRTRVSTHLERCNVGIQKEERVKKARLLIQDSKLKVSGLENGIMKKILLSNLQGKVLVNSNSDSESWELELTRFTGGVYVLQILEGELLHTMKFVYTPN